MCLKQRYLIYSVLMDGLDRYGIKKKLQKRGFRTKKEAEEWYAHFMLQQSSDPTIPLEDF